MPSKSKKQHKFMAAVANNPEFAANAGVPQSVGASFMAKDKKVKEYQAGNLVEKVTPGKPYYSSEELRRGFEQTLPAATSSAQLREGPLGALSPRAAIQDTVTHGMDLFRGEEGKRGSRLARKVAGEVENQEVKKKKKRKKSAKKKNMGGMIKYGHGGKVRGYGMAKGGRPCKMVTMKGS